MYRKLNRTKRRLPSRPLMLRTLAIRLGNMMPKHPLPMRTTFRDCFLVNFSMEPETLARVLPSPLEAHLVGGRAFLSVVIADMDRMRPAFLPAFCGVTYQQVVYRAVVRCGRERGVHFLRSDADNRLMVLMGNLLSFFGFHEAHIISGQSGGQHHIDLATAPGDHANIHASFDLTSARRIVPDGSVFQSVDEAQASLVELYAAFHPQPGEAAVRTVRIKRSAWNIQFVDEPRSRFDFMNGSAAFPVGSTRLDSVIYVEDVDYFWHTLDRPGGQPPH
jgi:uncharacterized protein YqjF (DUF2071 family)